MRRALLRRSRGSLLVMGVLAALWTAVSAPAQAEYPVDYNFFAGIPYELTDPNGSLPGANDWSCRPTAEHPNPVVLLHGTAGGGQTNWGLYPPLLANEGYCVYSLTYGAYNVPWPLNQLGGMRPIPESSAQVGVFVDRVLAATGAARVDLIAHSQGNVVGNYFIKRTGGHGKVDKFVAISPPWLGTYGDQMNVIRTFGAQLGVAPAVADNLIGAGICQACPSMLGGSEFLGNLNADGVYDPDVTYTNITSVYDEIVVPYTTGLVQAPNATNIVLQDSCSSDYSEHLGIAGSPRTAAFALNALDPEHPRTVPCEFVPPFTG